MQIPRAIRELRAALGLTQRQFATACGLGHGTISHVETGAKRPDSGSLVALARVAFDIDQRALAELFLALLPGVAEGLLAPSWLPAAAQAAPDSDFPRRLFHRTKDPVIVHSRIEERLRGPEWARQPWPKPDPSELVLGDNEPRDGQRPVFIGSK